MPISKDARLSFAIRSWNRSLHESNSNGSILTRLLGAIICDVLGKLNFNRSALSKSKIKQKISLAAPFVPLLSQLRPSTQQEIQSTSPPPALRCCCFLQELRERDSRRERETRNCEWPQSSHRDVTRWFSWPHSKKHQAWVSSCQACNYSKRSKKRTKIKKYLLLHLLRCENDHSRHHLGSTRKHLFSITRPEHLAILALEGGNRNVMKISKRSLAQIV